MISRYVCLLVGVWFMLAPFVWGYPVGFLWWHSIVIGSVVLAVAASYLLGWNRVGGWLLIALGAYSMLSPFIHGYLTQQFAFWNDLVFGVVTIGLGVALGGAAIEYGGTEEAAV